MPHPDASFWTKIAPKYARDPIADMEAYTDTLERMRACLRPGDAVLELGAGTTTTARDLAGQVRDYLATDIAAGMIRIGEEKQDADPIPTLRLAVADGVPEGEFDVILALNLLHLVRDLETFLADIAARLAPGQLFISKTTCLGAAPFLARLGVRVMIPAAALIGKAPGAVLFLTPESLDAAITRAGFTIEETRQETGTIPRRFVVARRA